MYLIIKCDADPLSLSGLRQAHYIARCFQSGLSRQEVITKFSGDSELVQMWISFLVHNHWMRQVPDDEGNLVWIATDKGQKWLETIEEKFSNE